MRFIALTLTLGLLIAACGGGEGDGERVLQIGGGDFTEADFRLQTRAAFVEKLAGARALCDGLAGLDDEEAADLISELQSRQEDAPTPMQETEPDDRLRAAAIVKEECARIVS